MRVLFAQAGFDTTTRRNQAFTRLGTEATQRGLTPATLDFGGTVGPVTGEVKATVEGKPGIYACYTGTDAALWQAENDLYRWMDANGFVEGTLGTMEV